MGESVKVLRGAADSNIREALENVEVVMDEWTQTAPELGRPVPEPTGHRVMLA